jgi:hypothetical protein
MSRKVVKTVEYANEPVFINKDGTMEPYVPKTIVTHRGAYAASLDLILKHCADMHILTLTVLSEKYGIPVDDMVQTVMEDEGYKNMIVNPKLHAMGAFDEKDLAKVTAKDAMDEITEKMENVVIQTEAPPKPKDSADAPKLKVRRIRKPAAAEADS